MMAGRLPRILGTGGCFSAMASEHRIARASVALMALLPAACAVLKHGLTPKRLDRP